MRPVLQVALDLMQLNRSIAIAHEAIEGGVDWLEIGTPLIKSEGADAIRKFRTEFSGIKLVADSKTMDVGGFEVEIMAKAGADIVTVLGLSDDSTIEEAVSSGRKYGVEIMIDLINVSDVLTRAKEVEKLGASYVCLHMGIDSQMKGVNASTDILKKIVNELNIPVAVAGGITSETAHKYVENGASIIIVGGGIIKSEDASKATQSIKNAMNGAKTTTIISKKYNETELFEAFSKVSTCNISDAFHKKGVITNLKPYIKRGTTMVGRALTVQTSNGDWAKPIEAIDQAKEGDIIVIDVGGGNVAVWGELASNSAMNKGIKGVVIDGTIRDVEDIQDLGFPAFARNISPMAGEPKGYGGIGIEITVGGQNICTGDWIIGDSNGLIVIPKGIAVEIANRSLDVNERENRTREEIRRGSTLSKVNEIAKWEPVK